LIRMMEKGWLEFRVRARVRRVGVKRVRVKVWCSISACHLPFTLLTLLTFTS
jgi:hypothetical protein